MIASQNSNQHIQELGELDVQLVKCGFLSTMPEGGKQQQAAMLRLRISFVELNGQVGETQRSTESEEVDENLHPLIPKWWKLSIWFPEFSSSFSCFLFSSQTPLFFSLGFTRLTMYVEVFKSNFSNVILKDRYTIRNDCFKLSICSGDGVFNWYLISSARHWKLCKSTRWTWTPRLLGKALVNAIFH